MRFAKKILPIALMLILSTSCMDLSIDIEYSTYVLDLGIAHYDENKNVKFLMDDSVWLYPRQKVNAEVEIGKRYKIHYATNSFERHTHELSAEVLDIIPVPILNVSLFPDPSYITQDIQSIDVDRFWLGGGFLNASFNCETQSLNEVHYTQIVRSDFSDKDIHLRLYHYRSIIGNTEPLANTNHTISVPLNDISDYLSGGKNISIEVYENNKWVKYTIKALSPIGK